MGLGSWELGLILVLVLIVFGAGKLPDVFRQAGKGIRAFKDAADGKDDGSGESEPSEEKKAAKARKQLVAKDALDDDPEEQKVASAKKKQEAE